MTCFSTAGSKNTPETITKVKVHWSTWCMLWWPKLANNAKYRDFICMGRSYYQGYHVAYKTSKFGKIRACLVPLT